jgi:hypothetical protein
MRRILPFLLLALLTSCRERNTSNPMSGGHRDPNGGSVVRCSEKNAELGDRSAMVVDLFRIRNKLRYEGDTVEAIAENALNKFRINGDIPRADYYESVVKGLREDVIVRQVEGIATNIEIEPLTEPLPEGCWIDQAAIQKTEYGSNVVLIDKEIWEELDNLNKAALLLHEAIYSEVRSREVQDNITIGNVWTMMETLFIVMPHSEYRSEAAGFPFTEKLVLEGFVAIPFSEVASDIIKQKLPAASAREEVLFGRFGRKWAHHKYLIRLGQGAYDPSTRSFHSMSFGSYEQVFDYVSAEVKDEALYAFVPYAHRIPESSTLTNEIKFYENWNVQEMAVTNGNITFQKLGKLEFGFSYVTFYEDGSVKTIESKGPIPITFESFSNGTVTIYNENETLVSASKLEFNKDFILSKITLNSPAKKKYKDGQEVLLDRLGEPIDLFQMTFD